MKRTLSAVVTSVAAIGTVLSGATVASADRPDMCVSVNGDVKVQHGTAECHSVASDGAANVARVKGEDSVAIAGLTEGHFGNKAMVDGDRSYALAGSDVFWSLGGSFIDYPGNNNTAKVVGDDSRAVASDGRDNTAVVRGDRSEAIIEGSRCRIGCSTSNENTAIVVGDDSTASVSHGSSNTVSVTGDHSSAHAGEGSSNTATVVGDGSSAAAGAGSGNTATVIGDGSQASVSRAYASTAEVYSDEASARAGAPPFVPEPRYACADEPGEHAINENLCD